MEDLIAEIDEFLENSKMADTTFGKKAVNDGKFVSRLREGGECLPRTATRAREFISAQTMTSGATA